MNDLLPFFQALLGGGGLFAILTFGSSALAARRARKAAKAADEGQVRLAPPTWAEFEALREEQRLDMAAMSLALRDVADQMPDGLHVVINAFSLKRLKDKGYLPPEWVPSE